MYIYTFTFYFPYSRIDREQHSASSSSHLLLLLTCLTILITECESGRYGQNCGTRCGHCKNGSSCDRLIGTCPDGCDPGWTGLLCMQRMFYALFSLLLKIITTLRLAGQRLLDHDCNVGPNMHAF